VFLVMYSVSVFEESSQEPVPGFAPVMLEEKKRW